MVNISGTKISMTRGDTLVVQIIMTRSGEPYTPAEGDVLRFALKHDILQCTPIIKKTIPNSNCLLQLDPNDTKNLTFGDYVYDIELTMADGSVDTFINNATLRLLPEVC